LNSFGGLTQKVGALGGDSGNDVSNTCQALSTHLANQTKATRHWIETMRSAIPFEQELLK
jgi:hypothetical protein